ncbi:MAG TPA: DUF1761 family protein [Rhizomicrobium sp.]|nr:DUF1761 family protein [Rhizomicrobium sp.]
MWMMLVSIAVAGTLATFTDWLFMGVLFHERYMRYPEVWWPEFREKGDSRAILYSSILGYVATAAVIVLCAYAGARDIGHALSVAALAWMAGPLVLLVTNGFWMKIDPAVTFSHALGWLARFLIAGAAAGIVLS